MVSQRGKWLILVIVSLGLFMDLLDMSIVNVAVPRIMLDFGADMNITAYVITAYMVTIGIFEPVTAYLADTLGMKKIYILALFVFTLGSSSCAMSWSIHSLILFRISQAIGGGMIMPLALAIVNKTFTKKELPLAMGLMGIPLLVAPSLGPTLGGYLVEVYNWRWIFWVNVPVGITSIFLAHIFLKEFETVQKKLDLRGLILSSIGFASLFLAITNGSTDGWTSFEIVSLFITSVITLLLFFALEPITKDPLLDFRIFKTRVYSASLFVTFLLMVYLFGSLYLIPLFMQQLRNLGPFSSGLILIPEFLGAFITLPLSAIMMSRIGAVKLTVTGMILMFLGIYPLTHLQVITELHSVEMHLFVIGCGLGLSIMPSMTLALSALSEELVNQGSAFLNLVRQIGSALGVSILTSVIDQRAHYYMQTISENASPSNTVMFVNQFMTHFQSVGYTLDQSKQLAVAYGISFFQQQASVQAFHDAFGVAMIASVVGIIPALFLYKKGDKPT